MDYYKIGQRIRTYRKMNGLSQEELAERVNISTTHMSHIETANTKLSLPVLVDIAAVLRVRTDDLLKDCPQKTKNDIIAEISDIIDQCSEKDAELITDVIKAVKASLDKNA